MKTLEVRRHSVTKKGPAREHESLLSAAGVVRARGLGETLPYFDYVLAGPDRRHVETAVAMGYAVDEIAPWPSGYVPGVVEHHDQWTWKQPFARYAELLQASKALRHVVEEHLHHWRRAVDRVPDGGAALVISSGGSIEPGLVAAFPDGDFANWGPALQHLEGARLSFSGTECVEVLIQRLEAPGEVSLRRLEAADARDMVDVLASDELYKFTGGTPPTLESLTAQYESQARGRSPDGREEWLNWIVVDQEGEPVGYVQATHPTGGRTAEIAWVIGAPWQGRGYATTAVRLMLVELWGLGLREVVAHIHPGHAASNAVAARLGLRRTDQVVDGEVRWHGHLDDLRPAADR